MLIMNNVTKMVRHVLNVLQQMIQVLKAYLTIMYYMAKKYQTLGGRLWR